MSKRNYGVVLVTWSEDATYPIGSTEDVNKMGIVCSDRPTALAILGQIPKMLDLATKTGYVGRRFRSLSGLKS